MEPISIDREKILAQFFDSNELSYQTHISPSTYEIKNLYDSKLQEESTLTPSLETTLQEDPTLTPSLETTLPEDQTLTPSLETTLQEDPTLTTSLETTLPEDPTLTIDTNLNEDTEILDKLKSLTTSNISQFDIELKSVLPNIKQSNDYNSFFYKLNDVLITDDLYLDSQKIINICTYTIIENKSITPIILYLLHKNNETNSLEFPNFIGEGNIEYITNKNIEEIFKEFLKKPIWKGYLELNDKIYIFYEIDFEYNIQELNYNDIWWWATIFEIVNQNMVLNFPIHRDVYILFYENPLLISLFDDKNNKLEMINIGYFGEYYKFIEFSAEYGLPRESAEAQYGPFFYLTTYNYAGNYGTWNLLNKPIEIDGEKITIDDEGRYTQGAILRIAFYPGNTKFEFKDFSNLYKEPERYNGLYITTDNLSPIPNPKFIVRDINQLYYLSYHYINMDLIDRSTKFFKLINYNIK